MLPLLLYAVHWFLCLHWYGQLRQTFMNKLEIIPDQLRAKLVADMSDDLTTLFHDLKDAPISKGDFSFYTSVASVFSSKIEGEEIELDSYIKYKGWGVQFEPDYTRRVDDLYDAYQFATINTLNKETFAHAHVLLSSSLLPQHHRGKWRSQNMFVTNAQGQIEYVAPSPVELENEMQKFFNDLQILLSLEMSSKEAFFYAACLHLIFVKIHPWNDGNGRTARLLEKWFLAQKLGPKAWFLQSEKYYFENKEHYYQSLKNCGVEYQNSNWHAAIPFLKMLPASLNSPD
jgi:Fic family protein